MGESFRPEPQFLLGMTHRSMGQPAEAMVHYRSALDLSPQLAEAHINLASLMSAQGDVPVEALHHYERALDLRAWPPALASQAEYNAAICMHALGRIDDARAALRRSQTLAPDFAPAAELAAELAAKVQEGSDASDSVAEPGSGSSHPRTTDAETDGARGPGGRHVAGVSDASSAERTAAPTDPLPQRQQWRQPQVDTAASGSNERGSANASAPAASVEDAAALLAALRATQRQLQHALASPRGVYADRAVTSLLAQLLASGGQLLARELTIESQ